MFIYISLRAAQDHNKAAGRDTSSLIASSTRQEDPAATTRRRSSCFAFTCRSFSFGFPSRELHCLKVVQLISVSLVVNYLVYLIICVIICCVNYIRIYCAALEDPCLERQPKQVVVKKIKLL
jgi:hypothetical protein